LSGHHLLSLSTSMFVRAPSYQISERPQHKLQYVLIV